VTALNFGREPVDEEVSLSAVSEGELSDGLEGRELGRLQGGRLVVKLAPHQGRSLLIR
jgi:hypothetical protein